MTSLATALLMELEPEQKAPADLMGSMALRALTDLAVALEEEIKEAFMDSGNPRMETAAIRNTILKAAIWTTCSAIFSAICSAERAERKNPTVPADFMAVSAVIKAAGEGM